jgi:hypothetical protein
MPTTLRNTDILFNNGTTQDTAGLGFGQTWQDVRLSRAVNIAYQNTTGRPIQVLIGTNTGSASPVLEISLNNSTWVAVFVLSTTGGLNRNFTLIIPNNYYYRINGSAGIVSWTELR